MAAYHHIYDSFIHSFIAVCKAHCVDSTKSEARRLFSLVGSGTPVYDYQYFVK